MGSLGLLLSPPGPHYPKFPPCRPAWCLPDWAPKACQAGNPQTFTIFIRPHPSGFHRPAQSLLCKALPLSLWYTHTHTHTHTHMHTRSPFHWATTLRPAQISTPPACAHTGPHDLHCSTPLRPGKLEIYRHSQSPPDCTPQACQASDPQAFKITAGPCHSGLHRPAWSPPGCALHACRSLHDLRWDCAPKATKPAIYRRVRSPLHQARTFQACQVYARRPASLSQWRPQPVGPWNPTHLPPATGGLQTCLRDTDRQV
jgi:hypothetical protein